MTPLILHPAVRSFLRELSADVKDKTEEQLRLIEKFGRRLPPPDSKKIARKLFELRVQGRTQVRIIYGFAGEAAVLVNGFVKKSKKIPPREIELALRRFAALARQ